LIRHGWGLSQAGVKAYYRILKAPSPESPFYASNDTMQPLKFLSKSRCTKIRFVLTDIDDTVTTEGRLTGEAYMALERLSEAGLTLIPITGRPAGWCDHIARMWPVSSVVGENGAFYLRYDHVAHRMHSHYWASEEHRAENRQKLNLLSSAILKEVPGSALASDQAYRQADLAIDFCEDVEPLQEAAVLKIVQMFRDVGAQAKVSSIHVNGWFGQYDKLSMTRTLFAREFGMMLEDHLEEILFIGDSPNDEPMFKFFNVSIGVANIQTQLHRLTDQPKFVTDGQGGSGFVEMANWLLDQRK
jgi:HAD superfamily hydrolase (TIGR01484 family)